MYLDQTKVCHRTLNCSLELKETYDKFLTPRACTRGKVIGRVHLSLLLSLLLTLGVHV